MLILLSAPIYAQININLTVLEPTCFGYTNGIIQSEVSGGTTPYTYLWSNGQATASLYSASSGDFSLTVTDADGNTATSSITVNQPGELVVLINPIGGDDCAAVDGSLEAVVSGGTPPYEIEWDNGTEGAVNDDLQSGSNIVNVTDASGCTGLGLIIIGDPMSIELVTNDITCNGATGSIALGITGGQGPFTYAWSTGFDGQLLESAGAGTYSVSVTDGNGCTLTTSATLTEPTPLELDVELDYSVSPCGQPISADATLAVTGGETPYQITWSNGATGTSATGLNYGSHTAVVTDARGCTESILFVLEKPKVISCSITAEQPSCTPESTASATINGLGGMPPYSYLWQTGETTQTLTDLEPGTYSATITDVRGCFSTCKVEILEGQEQACVLSSTPAACGGNGAIMVTIPTSAAPFTINWLGTNGESGSTTTSDNVYTITELPEDIYTITYTDAEGCGSSCDIEVISEGELIYSVSTTEADCGTTNGSITIAVSTGTPNYTISWTGPENGTAENQTSPFTLEGVPSGEYDITVVDASGCTKEKNGVIVEDNTYDLNLTLEAECDSTATVRGVVNISWDTTTGPYTIVYSGPGTAMTIPNYTGTSFELADAVDGVYSVIVTDAKGCDGAGEVTVDCPIPACVVNIEATVINGACGGNGTINGLITAQHSSGNFIVSWMGPSTGDLTPAADGTFTITDLAEGEYTLLVTDMEIADCSDQMTATVGMEPSISLSMDPQDGFCETNGLISGTINGGSGAYTLSWTGPTNGAISVSNNTFTIEDLPAGTYVVTAADSSNADCSDQSEALIEMQPGLSFVTIPVDGACEEKGAINATINGGSGSYIINWEGSSTGTMSVQAGNFTIPNLEAGAYTITASDNASANCQEQKEAIINVSPGIEVALGTVNGACAQGGTINGTITGGSGSFTVNWTGPTDGNITINGNSFEIPDLTDGTYSIIITDTENAACTTDSDAVIEETETLDLVLNAQDGLCGLNGGVSGEIAGGSGVYVLSWTGPTSGTMNVDGNSFELPNLGAGTYHFTASDNQISNCADQESATLELTQGLSIDTDITNGLCGQPGLITIQTLGGSGAYNIEWTGPESGSVGEQGNTAMIGVGSAGTYTITATDVSFTSCAAEIEATIDFIPNLMLDVIPQTGFCGEEGAISGTIEGGSNIYLLEWEGPSSTGMTQVTDNTFEIPNLPAGVYTLTALDEANDECQEEMDVTLQTSGNLELTAINIDAICSGNGAISGTIEGGSGNYTLSWSGESEGSMEVDGDTYEINDLPLGHYFLTVTDALSAACVAEVETSLKLVPLYVFATATNGLCGQEGAINGTINGGSGDFTLTWNGPTSGTMDINGFSYEIPSLGAGMYTISVEDNSIADCDAETEAQLEIELLEITAEPVDGVCGASGTISGTITGGSGNYILSWPGGTMNVDGDSYTIENLTEGEYTLTVMDNEFENCSDNTTAAVQIWGDIELTAVPTNGLCGALGSISGTITNGSGSYTISWPGGSLEVSGETYEITDLDAGTYPLTITDNANEACTDEVEAIIDIIDAIDATVAVVAGVCGQSGLITINMDGGSGVYNITWANTDGSENGEILDAGASITIPVTNAGDYTLIIKDANAAFENCETELLAAVAIESELVVELTTTPADCDVLGTVTGVITGGSGTYAVDGETIEGNTFTFTELNFGFHSYEVADLGIEDCITEVNAVVENGSEIAINIDATNVLCETPGRIEIVYICGQGSLNGLVSSNGSEIHAFILSSVDDSEIVTELETGEYLVELSDEAGNVFSETVMIEQNMEDVPVNITATLTSLRPGETATLCVETATPGDYSFLWSTGDTTQCITTPAEDNVPTNFIVEVRDTNGCSGNDEEFIDVPTICEEPHVFLPNAFSPNGDGENDIYILRSVFIDKINSFIIYNRWGEEVFSASSLEEGMITGWDGTFEGKELPPDVYGYYIDVQCIGGVNFVKKGNVTLLR